MTNTNENIVDDAMRNVINERDTLLNELNRLQNVTRTTGVSTRDDQKRIRRQLRALNHFGATRARSSRYYDAHAKTTRDDALHARDARIALKRACAIIA